MPLIFPAFEYRLKKNGDKSFIFDTIRKKFVALTPEEWVRQHVVHYLINHKGYAPGLIAIEKEINLNGLKRRFDIVCFNRQNKAVLIVECKAPNIPLSQIVFDQAFKYNHIIAASYVMITNGISFYCGKHDIEQGFSLLKEIPLFDAT